MLVVEPSIFDVLWCSQRGECGVGWIEDRYRNVFKPKAPQYNRHGGSRIVWKCKMSLWTQFGDLETGGAHLCNLLSFSSKFPADKKPSSLWRKILQWKQIRDQKLNLGSTMGSFSTPNSLSQHHFLCFSAKRGRTDPFPNYLTTMSDVDICLLFLIFFNILMFREGCIHPTCTKDVARIANTVQWSLFVIVIVFVFVRWCHVM